MVVVLGVSSLEVMLERKKLLEISERDIVDEAGEISSNSDPQDAQVVDKMCIVVEAEVEMVGCIDV